MADNDPETAALAFQQALSGDPGNRALAEAAFQAAVLAGRPMALSLAQRLPDDPAALMVRADADIKAGHWQAAESAFARLPTTGPTQMLQPLLTAWAEQGSGDTDAALGILRPYVEGTRSRGLFALHAAMINDLAGRQVEAARLYRVALVEFGTLNLRVGSLVASWQARSGRDLEAHDTIRAMVQSNPDLSIAETALQQDVASAGPRSAVDGVAESYLAMAASLQQQNSTDMAMVLLRLAIELRPDFTSARLLMAVAHGPAVERGAAAPGALCRAAGAYRRGVAQAAAACRGPSAPARAACDAGGSAEPAGAIRRCDRDLQCGDRAGGHAEPDRLAAVLWPRHRL
jgi:tetratricopeptide (TPR) repeat protein